jgi:hypothetical protein
MGCTAGQPDGPFPSGAAIAFALGEAAADSQPQPTPAIESFENERHKMSVTGPRVPNNRCDSRRVHPIYPWLHAAPRQLDLLAAVG